MILLTSYLYDIIASVNRRLRNLKMAKKVKDYYDVPYLEELAGKIMVVTSNFNEDKDKFNFIINTWKTDKNISKECEWVIKHGSRTADKK